MAKKQTRQKKAPRKQESKKRPVEVLTHREVMSLMDACVSSQRTGEMMDLVGIRNRAIIVILYRAGLRCGEMIDLQMKDVDLGRLMIKVLHGKGDKGRVVGIDPQTAEHIQKWIDVRAELPSKPGNRGYLFCNQYGDWLWPGYVRKLFKRLAKKAGITKRVHPHGLRHTHAYELADENVSVQTISQQLGHTRIATTIKYIDHLNPKQRIDQMKQRKW